MPYKASWWISIKIPFRKHKKVVLRQQHLTLRDYTRFGSSESNGRYESVWFVVAICLKSQLFRDMTPRLRVTGSRRFETTKGSKRPRRWDIYVVLKCQVPVTQRHIPEERKLQLHRRESLRDKIYWSLVLFVRYNLTSIHFMPRSRLTCNNGKTHSSMTDCNEVHRMLIIQKSEPGTEFATNEITTIFCC
jgi:hypothetical protein